MFHVVLRRSGPSFDPSLPLESQSGWAEHAAFMDGLVADGFIVLGGPLGAERVVHVVKAPSAEAVRERLASDPWSGSHLVVDEIEPWEIRLGVRLLTARVKRFVTFVSWHQRADPRTVSFGARLDAELDDGRRVVLLDDRGWGSGAHGVDVHPPDTRADLEFTARTVVGPDGAFDDFTDEDMAEAHWDWLVRELRTRGVESTVEELMALPHDVELDERTAAWVSD